VSDQRKRTTAEWTTFVVSCLVLAVVVGLIAVQAVGTADPARPTASIKKTTQGPDGRSFVSVDVTNRGDDTASQVQVTAELTIDGEATTADQTIDFLAGDESEDLVFVFEDDPSDGELTVTVSGFAIP